MNASIFAVTQIYLAYFGRAPEPEGLDFWVGRLASGVSTSEIARQFSGTAEAQALYPTIGDDPTTFLQAVYRNLFNRDLEPEGDAFWSGEIAAGADLGTILLRIVEAAQGTDITTVQNKVDVAHYFTTLSELDNKPFSIEDSRDILSDVDYTAGSVNAAKIEAQKDTIGVIKVPGPVTEVPVEVPVEPDHIVTYNPNGTLDITATKNFDGVEMPFGDGNLPINYNIALDQTANLELGLKVHYRTGDDVLGTVVSDGVLSYEIAAGPQRAGQGGADVNALNRSAASVDFSINEGVGRLGADDLTYHLWVDIDRTEATDFVKISFVEGPGGRWYGVEDGTENVLIGDSAILPHQITNSINFGFNSYASRIDGVGETSGDIPAGQYDIRLFATNSAGTEVVGITSILNLVDAA